MLEVIKEDANDTLIGAPAEVLQDQGRGGRIRRTLTNLIARSAKRKLKNVWYEDGGRYLYRYGANGSTVFGPLYP